MYITVGLSKYLCGGSLITDQWVRIKNSIKLTYVKFTHYMMYL